MPRQELFINTHKNPGELVFKAPVKNILALNENIHKLKFRGEAKKKLFSKL